MTYDLAVYLFFFFSLPPSCRSVRVRPIPLKFLEVSDYLLTVRLLIVCVCVCVFFFFFFNLTVVQIFFYVNNGLWFEIYCKK